MTSTMQRAVLFAKGMCMGVADVIPGVSGGTLALVLGVYKEFVDTLEGLHLRWVGPLLRWLSGGRQDEDWHAFMDEFTTLNLGFLVTLVAGIGTAILVGSAVIPGLMERYPTYMRAFFFGLILASVYVPGRMIAATGKGAGVWGPAVALGLVGMVFGYVVTNPGTSLDVATQSVEITSRGESLKDLARRGPSAVTAEEIYWADDNAPLRDAVTAATPEKAKELAGLRAAAGKRVLDKKSLKARAEPYHGVEVPEGTVVHVVQPALWFIFFAGAIAICAMILPGISGSYILLIFGVYFFILNTIKGSLSLLASGEIPVGHIVVMAVFGAAIIVGILSFARVLSFLLDRYAAPTLGALVGLMLGCLRGIWPFRDTVDGVVVNVAPAGPEVTGAIVLFVVGAALVAALSVAGRRLGDPEAA